MLGISSHREIDENISKKFLSTSDVLLMPKAAKVLAHWLAGMGTIFFIVLFLPWQQNIQAEGSVTALNPEDRPQTVESAIAGRIKAWHVMEGQYVKAGDTILVLEEIREKYFDPELLTRLQEQIKGKEEAIAGYLGKIESYKAQIAALQQALDLNLAQQTNKIRQMRLKVATDSAELEAERVNLLIAKRQQEAGEEMVRQGLIALITLEARRSKLQETSAKVVSAENKYLQSQQELINTQIELNVKRAEYLEKISKARSDLNDALAGLANARAELAKLKNEYANMKIRSEQYVCRAPQDGIVVKALKAGIGETIKEQEPVATIMPANPQVAVELYVKPMDVPLLSVGRKVRLEFDGWPALQFSGWPSVAVGTFGGQIAVIDAVDSKDGKYRVLVKPDPEDEPWPRQLRQGSGVLGWAMLDDVPLWYEIWRQLNGFPPSLKKAPDQPTDTPDKK
ncbi:MAG: HlyD family efflux transporter periplasmic adaptor subunit [Cytophagales bacterium]|nr:HlyD family secretion protein [Bernardetiaceae bacterium]MDW8211559.1 HlyD family efflux transporter periplasmic adaptor subunit [Cytophagales bacterium]